MPLTFLLRYKLFPGTAQEVQAEASVSWPEIFKDVSSEIQTLEDRGPGIA